jgi:hypothetical protein
MTTFSRSPTKLTALLPESHDCSCYACRQILAPPPHWLQKHTDLRAHKFAHFPDFGHQPRLADVTRAWSWRLCGINAALTVIKTLMIFLSFRCNIKNGTYNWPYEWQRAGPHRALLVTIYLEMMCPWRVTGKFHKVSLKSRPLIFFVASS